MPVSQAPRQTSTDYRPWAVFQHGDFNVMLAGGVAMVVASTLTTLVSGQWLYEKTNSAAQLGLLGAVHLVQMPVALYGGTLADSIDRKKLMVATQSVAFVMLLTLTILAATDQLAPWHIFAVTGISGVVGLLGGSARPAMLPRVIPRRLLINGVTTQNVTFQIAAVGAPFLFWQMFELFGVTTSFAVATGIALFATAMPLMLRASGRPEGGSVNAPIKSLKEGYAFIMGHQLLPGLFLLDMGVTVVSFYRMLFPVFADQLYGLGASGTGLLSAANSIGSILGSSVVFLTDRLRNKGKLVLFATLAYAFLLFAFGLNTVFAIGLVIVAALGAMDSIGMTMRQAIAQLTVPDKLLGRASSAHSFTAMGANNLGQIEVGVLSAAIGAGSTMVVGGAISVVAVLTIWWFVPGIRRYRYDPSNPFGRGERD
jgi:MFS family permease